MSQPDPLFDMDGPADAELARLERELAPLRWQARELPREALVSVDAGVPIDAALPRDTSRSPARTRVWLPARALPWLAGLVAAAAVLGLASAMRATPPEPQRVPASLIQPAGSPPAPDLRDPFAGVRETDAPASAPDLRDPFTPRRVVKTPTAPTRSDLRDPFDGVPSESWTAPSTRPAAAQDDLLDPFSRNRDASTRPDLRDPFAERSEPSASTTGSAADMPGSRSPDLVDPFARPH